jgi:regulatory protein
VTRAPRPDHRKPPTRAERQARIAELTAAEQAARARELALKRLGTREYSRAELRTYLRGKGFGEEVIDACVERLGELGFVDDRRYARMLTRHQTLRGKGPRYVQQKLTQKGVRLEGDELAALIREVVPGDPAAQARQIVDRRYPGWREDRAVAGKAFQALVRRGFSFEVARRALDGRIELAGDDQSE